MKIYWVLVLVVAIWLAITAVLVEGLPGLLFVSGGLCYAAVEHLAEPKS